MNVVCVTVWHKHIGMVTIFCEFTMEYLLMLMFLTIFGMGLYVTLCEQKHLKKMEDRHK